MGSEEVDVQCNQQPAAVSDSCDSSTAAVGIANIPYQLAENPSMSVAMSVAPSQASTPTPVTGAAAAAAILGQSAASHTPPQNVAVQPSVPASPLPHVQVIQQPLQSQYLQHLYAPQQQHMFLPGNLTIQPAIQSIAGAPGLSLQLQGKTLDGKAGGPAIISATPVQTGGNFSAPNLMPAGSQMITAGAKTCVQGQMLAATSKSTAVLQGQSTFIPSTSTGNQTVVIGQLGMLANQPSIIPHQAKAVPDSQKNKSFVLSQPATLHPKSPILPSPNTQCAATGQMVASNQLKQIPTAPHIISSQAPTMLASQAQILGSLQALGASLPQGITWGAPGSLHSPALFGQNPIFIRSQQSDMFIQTPPPQATLHAVPVAPAAPTATAGPPAPTPAPAAVSAAATVTASPVAAAAAPATTPQSVAAVAPAVSQHIAAVAALPTQATTVAVPATVSTPTVAPAPPPPTPAAVSSAPPSTSQPAISAMPTQKLKQVRPASSVATQTTVTTSSSSTLHSSITKTQAKQRQRPQLRSSPALSGSSPVAHHQSAATQTQTVSPPSLKADAANQTKMLSDTRSSTTFNKSLSTDITYSVPEEKMEKPMAVVQEVHPTIASPSPATNVAATSTVETPPPMPDSEESVAPEAEETSMEVEEPSPPPPPPPPEEEEEEVPMEKEEEHMEEAERKCNGTVAEAESIGVVAPLTETIVKEATKQPQKAIVKPHVLTHVIEGFVIQEGSEPFPVSRPHVQNNSGSARYPSNERQISSSPIAASVPDTPVILKKKEKMPKIRGGPVELAKCEYCGKLGPKAKFKRSKRFCSTSCAKRYNAGCSKRHSLATSDSDQKHSSSGKSGKKKKLGFKSKKSWKKSQNRSYEISSWVQPPSEPSPEESTFSNSEDKVCSGQEMPFEVTETSVVTESTESAVLPTSQMEDMEKESVPHNIEFATKSPLKWTVTDVFDFVRNLPGCSEYADEFRSQEIDGQALLLLKEDHLMSTMSMKLGPALKVCARINSLREEAHH